MELPKKELRAFLELDPCSVIDGLVTKRRKSLNHALEYSGRFSWAGPEKFVEATAIVFLECRAYLVKFLNISETFRLGVGGGYRFIGGAGRLQNRLDGFTANVALKMSFF